MEAKSKTEGTVLLRDDKDAEQKTDYIKTLEGISAAFCYVLLSVVSASTVQLIEQRIPDFELAYHFCCIVSPV